MPDAIRFGLRHERVSNETLRERYENVSRPHYGFERVQYNLTRDAAAIQAQLQLLDPLLDDTYTATIDHYSRESQPVTENIGAVRAPRYAVNITLPDGKTTLGAVIDSDMHHPRISSLPIAETVLYSLYDNILREQSENWRSIRDSRKFIQLNRTTVELDDQQPFAKAELTEAFAALETLLGEDYTFKVDYLNRHWSGRDYCRAEVFKKTADGQDRSLGGLDFELTDTAANRVARTMLSAVCQDLEKA